MTLTADLSAIGECEIPTKYGKDEELYYNLEFKVRVAFFFRSYGILSLVQGQGIWQSQC